MSTSSLANPPWRIVHSEASLGWGGQERRIWAELTGFRARGHHVGLIAPARAALFEKATGAALSRDTLSEKRWHFPFAVIRAAQYLKRFRADIVNTHSSRDGWIVGLAARMVGAPLIIRSRHFDVPVPNPWLSKHVYASLADHLITTSPKVAADFRTLFGLPEDRVTAIPTGVDLSLFSPEGPRASLEFPPEIAGPIAGIVGIIRRAKGHAVLFEAIRRLLDSGFPMRCVVVGDGPSRSLAEQRASELDLGSRVLFLGTRDDVPALLRSFDVLAIPSLHEAIPQAGLQALATKTPVVASDVGGIPAIIRHGETGRLCVAGDSASLASMLRETVSDQAATDAMRQRGRKMVELKHTLEAMLDDIEAIYRRHFEGRPLPRRRSAPMA